MAAVYLQYHLHGYFLLVFHGKAVPYWRVEVSRNLTKSNIKTSKKSRAHVAPYYIFARLLYRLCAIRLVGQIRGEIHDVIQHALLVGTVNQ